MKLETKFSKELAGDLRRETAKKLRATRKQPASFKKIKSGLPEVYGRYQNIKESYEQLEKDVFGKIFKTEKFRQKERFLNEMLKSVKEHNIKKVKDDYDEKLNNILKNCPLTLEEREKYLSTEAMEKMPLDDYLVLLKRLSGEAFYHVTRYGIRENTFMSTGGGHTSGEGEFVDSFTPLLKDGNINSCTSTIISNEERAKSMINKEALREFKEKGMSVDEVVDKVIGSYGTIYFLDKESAHFSYGKELHNMYGGRGQL